MQLGMIGLGRMGANMVRRLVRGGHACVAYDRSAEAVGALKGEGATGAASAADLIDKLTPPRTVWLMVPAAVVDDVVTAIAPLLRSGDVIVDGGNSSHADDLARAARLAQRGIHYVDVGVSGGVWGLERGFCLMIGGEGPIVTRLEPLFATLAPGGGDAVRAQAARAGADTATLGYLHCGPTGAGHFVKMVHNGIEYGLMAAYAEGLNILRHANAGAVSGSSDAETAPLRNPELYRYDLDIASITQVWRRGSVISSWLLDLTAAAFAQDAGLSKYAGQVSDSGEGRWTLQAANDLGVPAHVLAAALFERFASRNEDEFQNRVLSAMRFAFGGHLEKR
jgi:6-phosphogluconate dehydrogenase